MAVKITDYSAKIESDLLQKGSLFLRLAAEEVVNLSQRKTPKKTGRLRMDVIKQALGNNAKIIWGKKYAIYQEEKQFKKYTTPGTGPHFARNAINDVVKNTNGLVKKAGLIL